jgi:hypothetical protein
LNYSFPYFFQVVPEPALEFGYFLKVACTSDPFKSNRGMMEKPLFKDFFGMATNKKATTKAIFLFGFGDCWN